MPKSKPPRNGGDEFSRVRFSGEVYGNGGERRRDKVTAGVPLAKIIKPRLVKAAEIVVFGRSPSAAAGRFRQLTEMLEDLGPKAPQTIVITSAGPAEGRSLVAMNLALAYAARNQGDVILLEADLRRPAIGRWIAPEPKVGLAELLSGRTELEHVLLEMANSPLHVLPAGEPPEDPVELLVSDELTDLVVLLKDRFRHIVIDTPPIVPFTDADLVARFSDGALVVARAGLTRRGPLAQALASVTAAPVLGMLLNDSTAGRPSGPHL
jgi:capsular exopolysaccharide synthesis family protein